MGNGENLPQRLLDHPARHRVDRPFPDRDREPRLGHPADADATIDNYKPIRWFRRGAACCARYVFTGRSMLRPYIIYEGHRRMDRRPVGHVRVVAGVLDHEAGGEVLRELLAVEAKPGMLPGGEGDLRLLHQVLLPEHERRPLGRRSRAGTGGVAVTEHTHMPSPARISSALTTAAATFD